MSLLMSFAAPKMQHQKALHQHSRCTVLRCSSTRSISRHHDSNCILQHSIHNPKLGEHSYRTWAPVVQARQPLQPLPGQRHSIHVAAAPEWEFDFDKNPQNTQNPKVLPNPSLSPREAVAVQLNAISHNDDPWDNHGVQTMYEFAEDCGSMERSRYFGFSKDLYHLDHFLGAIKTACGALVDCKSYTLLDGPPDSLAKKPIEALPAGMEAVYVAVQDSKGADGGVFELRLVQREFGLKAGCWMTKSCLKVK